MLDGFGEHDECEITERRIVPNAVDLARLFGPLESLGVGCDVSNALSHLMSAKRAFLEARHEREGRKQQQNFNYRVLDWQWFTQLITAAPD